MPVAIDQREHRQIYPAAGWVEHDPLEILERSREVIRSALAAAGIRPAELAAVGITNQRETTVVWERRTGQPIHNAIVWQDTRTDQIVAELAGAGGPDRFRAATGLPLATYFSGPKDPLDPRPRGGGAGNGPRPASCSSGRSTPGSSGTSAAGRRAAST